MREKIEENLDKANCSANTIKNFWGNFFSLIQNFKNFKTVRTLKIQKKRPNLDQKLLLKINNYEKTNKKEGMKERQPSKTPPFFFFLSSSFVFITHNHLHKKTSCRRFGAFPAPSLRLKFKKKELKTPTYHLSWGYTTLLHERQQKTKKRISFCCLEFLNFWIILLFGP